MNNGLLVFCCPGDAYLECNERDAVLSHQMIDEAFDKAIRFSPDYVEFASIPDVEMRIGKKFDRLRIMQAFLKQPLSGIGEINGELTSTNYLFHIKNPDVLPWKSPDLDITYFNGDLAEKAAQEVQKLYRSFGWDSEISHDNIRHKKFNLKPQSRLYRPTDASVRIHDPHSLIEKAQSVVAYDPDKFYWGVQDGS